MSCLDGLCLRRGQKYLVMSTTGEEDLLAFAQALYSKKDGVDYWTPVVGVTCGDRASSNNLRLILSI